MKPFITFILIILSFYIIGNIFEEKVKIPEESIRLRVVANMNALENNINEIFNKNNYHKNYNINLGLNYFPQKDFKGIIYKEGYYESLLVTIGEGKGNNWWCVLFPPLCVLEAEESDTVEYKSLIKEIIDKYL